MGVGRCAHFKGCCVLQKGCVSIGEPAEALPLAVSHTAVERNSAYYIEATINLGTPCFQRLYQKPKLPMISGTQSPVNPGAAQPCEP